MSWWRSFFRRRPAAAELDSELHHYIEQLIDEKIAAGLTPENARREALLDFAGREQIEEELRDVHRITTLENTLANLRSGFRFIRKSPSFSSAVILTLALGVGANTAVFSVINAILFRPLAFPDSDRDGSTGSRRFDKCTIPAWPAISENLGLVLAETGSNALRNLANALPRAQEITLDWRILLHTACTEP